MKALILLTAPMSILAILLGVIFAYHSVQLDLKHSEMQKRLEIGMIDVDWRDQIAQLTQFQRKDTETVEIQNVPANEAPTLDPKNIEETKLIGLLESVEKSEAIVMFPVVDEKGQLDKYDARNVIVGETVLGEWRLKAMNSTSATWHNKTSDKVYVQHIFKPFY